MDLNGEIAENENKIEKIENDNEKMILEFNNNSSSFFNYYY